MRRRVGALPGLALAAAAFLAGCTALAPVDPVPVPPGRPDGLAAPSTETAVPSARSRALANYYARFEASQVAKGLMRTDGGGVDTPFNARMLQDNFERIAFYDEYQRGAGLRRADNTPGRLRRWTAPIVFTVEHGAQASAQMRASDRAEVGAYVDRLRRITGHPMRLSDTSPNFHVLYTSADEIAGLGDRVQEIVPNINQSSLDIFANLPRSIHCLVIAFSGTANGYDYARAIAVIRAEHPPLMRASCVHEEIAQGLGLANDSPLARPSIFNDDDEFALLTTHDEMLLEMLYDPALRPGMSLQEARPIIARKANALIGPGSG